MSGGTLIKGVWHWDPVEWSKDKRGFWRSNRVIPDEYWNQSWDKSKKNTAGVILIRGSGNEREFLIIQSYGNYYGWPKGKVESKETMKDAAEREFREEIGTVISLDGSIELRQSFGTRILSMFILEVDSSFKITSMPRSDHEITSWGWCKENDLWSFKMNRMSRDFLGMYYKFKSFGC